MKHLYRIILVGLLLMVAGFSYSQDLSGVIIYINPGHGGYDSDDRNMVIYPYTSGDPNGFWESQSNLDKGTQLQDLLKAANATTYISRTTNTTADDLPLSQIVREANECNADYMLSIHSNAGVTNYILQLYAGIDPGDTHVYPSATPWSDRGREISTAIAINQYSNEVNCWASSYAIRGDKTFARTAMGWSNGYGVLRGLAVPGCISEGSMHDYIPETRRLMNMEYKWLEAWHFFKAFCQVFNGGDIPTGNIAGSVHDSRNKDMNQFVKIRNSKDELLTLDDAVITVNPGNLVYRTDNIVTNGVFAFKQLQPGTYTVNVACQDYFDQDFELVVKANETTYLNAMLNKKRLTPPEVINYSPNVAEGELVECSTKLIFEFNWDVDTESAINAFSITPEVKGTISFEDSQHRMIFSPDKPYDVSTTYTVKLDKSLKHPADMSMVEDFTFDFTTKDRNRLVMFAAYPTPGVDAVHYGKALFEYRFDNELNSAIARDGIKIYDEAGTELTKAPRSIKVNSVAAPYGNIAFNLSNNLVENATYRVVINRDMIDVNGIDIVEPIEFTFKAVNIGVIDKAYVLEPETEALFVADEDKSNGVASSAAAISSDKAVIGSKSAKLSYTFQEDGENNVAYFKPTATISVTNDKAIGLHLCGDLTGNEVWLHFADANGNVQDMKVGELTTNDWTYVEADLSPLTTDAAYTFDGISVKQASKPLSKSGTVYLDNVVLDNSSSTGIVNASADELAVYYDEAGKTIIVNSDKVQSMKLYSISGGLIAYSNLNRMNVETLLSGIYVVEIQLEDGNNVSRKVVIN